MKTFTEAEVREIVFAFAILDSTIDFYILKQNTVRMKEVREMTERLCNFQFDESH